MKTVLDDTREIYKRFLDQESRHIFLNRFLYSATGDLEYIKKMIRGTGWWKQLSSILRNLHDKVFIFGAGGWGRDFLIWLEHCEGFIDNSTAIQGTHIDGRQVYSLKAFIDEYGRQSSLIVIVNYLHHAEIKQQCVQAGIPRGRIVDIGSLIENMMQAQYFDLEDLRCDDDEVFVDVGCLNGATVWGFIKWCQGKYRHIYCFEPDTKCFSVCSESLSDLINEGNVTLIEKGVGAVQGKVRFQSADRGMSSISVDGNMEIDVMRLDDVFCDTRVTFLKMDIEGAERDALRGAEHVIRRDRPKLAISVYHRKEDIVKIPALLLDFQPNYTFYMRHYSLSSGETVLYAI